jgi:phage shock protein C
MLFAVLVTTAFTVIVTIVMVGRMVSGKIGLHRSKKSRIVAGVAGGFAQALGVDPIWTRLVWIILLIPGGLPGFFPYIICWIMIPSEE